MFPTENELDISKDENRIELEIFFNNAPTPQLKKELKIIFAKKGFLLPIVSGASNSGESVIFQEICEKAHIDIVISSSNHLYSR